NSVAVPRRYRKIISHVCVVNDGSGSRKLRLDPVELGDVERIADVESRQVCIADLIGREQHVAVVGQPGVVGKCTGRNLCSDQYRSCLVDYIPNVKKSSVDMAG